MSGLDLRECDHLSGYSWKVCLDRKLDESTEQYRHERSFDHFVEQSMPLMYFGGSLLFLLGCVLVLVMRSRTK